jgi:hypothetical protein
MAWATSRFRDNEDLQYFCPLHMPPIGMVVVVKDKGSFGSLYSFLIQRAETMH